MRDDTRSVAGPLSRVTPAVWAVCRDGTSSGRGVPTSCPSTEWYIRVSPTLWEWLHYHAFNKRKSIRSVVRDLLESYHQQERAREQTRPTTGSSTGKEEQ